MFLIMGFKHWIEIKLLALLTIIKFQRSRAEPLDIFFTKCGDNLIKGCSINQYEANAPLEHWGGGFFEVAGFLMETVFASKLHLIAVKQNL